ncbi:MAG: 3-phosphoserine/phosphohydroxythreonine transaminase [Flavobacteriales bacterium]|nr:3-phosphoserine/phosphohydroxythreonine transaminase [Flavobacteriales bacterium]
MSQVLNPTDVKKIHNFSAGPGILPQEVFKQAAQAVLNYEGSGLSLMEMSHRSKEFIAVMDKAIALVKDLLQVPEGYQVLFLQGGASTQFTMVPCNLLPVNGKAAYINTGEWARKAAKEAKLYGQVDIIASSEDQNYNYIPKDYTIPTDAAYLHITTNNTIFGTQYKKDIDAPITVVADMSSDIFSRPVDVSKYGLIYAGAQKNMGPAGTTMVIVKEDLLGKAGRDIPTMLNYKTHIEKESMFNTPPVFPIYVSMLTMQWLKDNGGVAFAQKRNQEKFNILYTELESNPLFQPTAKKEDCSVMNLTFVLTKPELEEEFNAMQKEAGISGLKGHRSVGGYRASMYNAMGTDSVKALVEIMQALATKNG